MKIIDIGFLCLLTTMIGCGGNQMTGAAHKTDGRKTAEEFMATIKGGRYEAPILRKQQILNNYSRLQAGMTKTEIVSIIGEPDYGGPMYGPKGFNSKWKGWYWKYHLVWPDTRFINEKQDERIEIFFDTNDHATWIAPSDKTGLPHFGGITSPTPST